MKSVELLPEAELELWQAVDYYETQRTGLGLGFVSEVSTAFVRIQENPLLAPSRRHSTRCRLLSRFPYAIYYLETVDKIWIVAVAHTKRRPYYWRSRLQ